MTDFDTRTNDMQRAEHGWLNLFVPEVLDACTEVYGPVCPDTLQQIADSYDKYKIPSLYGDLPDIHGNGQGVFDIAHQGLDPKWEANLAAIATALEPFLANGSCVGVFVGDEIVASHGVPFDNYSAVVSRLRGLVGPEAILMANEGSDLWDWNQTKHDGQARFQVAPDLDFFSLDLYDGWNANGTWEVEMVRAIYEAEVFPAMSPTQRAFVVPGTFGCPGDLGPQAAQIVQKLEAYYAWAKAEPRIAGISPWHFANRTGAAHGRGAMTSAARQAAAIAARERRSAAPEQCPAGSFLCANTNICVPSSCSPCVALCKNPAIKAAHCAAAAQSAIGAEAMPEVVSALSAIGKRIVDEQRGLVPAAPIPLAALAAPAPTGKTTDDAPAAAMALDESTSAHGQSRALLPFVLAPAAPPSQQLYRNRSFVTWGGRPVRCGTLYCLVVTGFSRGCGLWPGWMTNSMSILATSKSVVGPFVWNTTLLDIYSTNADVFANPDGSLVAIASGASNPSIERPCKDGFPVPTTPPPMFIQHLRARFADTAAGPWIEKAIVLPAAVGVGYNPSPFVNDQNGTVTMILHTCTGGIPGTPNITCFTVVEASDGCSAKSCEFKVLGELNFLPVPSNCSLDKRDPAYKCPCHIEDPTIWFDRPLGKWRILMHQYPSVLVHGKCESRPDHYTYVGGYAESAGESAAGPWHFEYFSAAYSNLVTEQGGKVNNRSLRERPKVVLNNSTGGLDGGYIVNGACDSDSGRARSNCYTVIQQVLHSIKSDDGTEW
jgi:hypothetical protein